MKRKKQKCKCNFWRWLILTIARIKRLYFLVWGIVILLITACLKTDIVSVLGKIWP